MTQPSGSIRAFTYSATSNWPSTLQNPQKCVHYTPGQGIRSETESFSPYIVGVVGYRMVTLEGYYCSFMVGVVEVV